MGNLANINFKSLLPWLAAVLIAGAATYLGRTRLAGRAKALATYVGGLATVVLLALLAGKIGAILPQVQSDSPHARAVDGMKLALAVSAILLVFYELRRIGERRPVAERWKKFIGVSLGIMGVLLYFNTFKFGYPKYYHRWDQYHYYMGAKYFPEIGYDGLYKCTAIAQDEVGTAMVDVDDTGTPRAYNLRAEVRKSDKKIRNLSGDNSLVPASEFLENPKQCVDRFTPERWEQYKKDVIFFSTSCYLDKYWTDMQQDHGYNPPPVWTVAGYWLGNYRDANAKLFDYGDRFGGVLNGGIMYLQALALIDVAYILAAFAALYWAFGWRVFAVAGIFFGTQSSAPFYWTGGALLRQDWLFFYVMAACLVRKKYPALAGASLVYAGLLRVFPGLAVLGWLVVAGWYIVKHKRMKGEHVRMLAGGTLAAALLIGTSLAVVGKDSYQKFFHHTLKVHDQTPLTNHMGLRVLIGHDLGMDKSSGRMRYAKEPARLDPFATWKNMRVQRYIDYKPVAYTLIGSTFFAFALVLRRVKSMWVAQTVGGIWIILLSQLTCYYYSFMLLSATLTRARRDLEVYIFAFCAISQVGWRALGYNDDKYDYLTLASLILLFFLLLAFAPRELSGRRAEKPITVDEVVGELTKYTPAWEKPKGWRRLQTFSGQRLGTVVAASTGIVFAAMGAARQDWSTVIMGGVLIATGVSLWRWADSIRDGKASDAVSPMHTGNSGEDAAALAGPATAPRSK